VAPAPFLAFSATTALSAEYLSLPLVNSSQLPDKLADERAVFVEPLSSRLRNTYPVGRQQFRDAAVLGDGKLAQLIARVSADKVIPRRDVWKALGKVACSRVPPASRPEKSTQ